jgi:hypothetical protein
VRLLGRLQKLETVYGIRHDPEPQPRRRLSREERIESTAKWLHDVGTSAMWGMHSPEVWPALRDWFAARDGGTEEAQIRAYVQLTHWLSLAVEEYKPRSKGLKGQCNALPAINDYYGGRAARVTPLPECPRCRCSHTDNPEALQLVAERMREFWTNRAAYAARADTEWQGVAVLAVDGLPQSLREWWDAHEEVCSEG